MIEENKKYCARCKEIKLLSFFGNHISTSDGYRRWCKDCEAYSAVDRQSYYQQYRADKREKLDEYKSKKGCIICNEVDPRCLQFHHRDPSTKTYTISRLYSGTWGWDRIFEEIEKCDVMCANCHLKFHRSEDEKIRSK